MNNLLLGLRVAIDQQQNHMGEKPAIVAVRLEVHE